MTKRKLNGRVRIRIQPYLSPIPLLLQPYQAATGHKEERSERKGDKQISNQIPCLIHSFRIKPHLVHITYELRNLYYKVPFIWVNAISIIHNKKSWSQILRKAEDKQTHATLLVFPCLTIGINKPISMHIWHCNVHNTSSLLSCLRVIIYSLLQC